MNQDTQYRIAKKRVKRKRGFFRHLSTFMVIGAFFFMLNMLTDPFDMWFFFPMLPWSVGLAFHFLGVFVWGKQDEWEEREIEKEMKRIEGRTGRRGRTVEIDDYEELELDDLPPKQRRSRESRWDDEDFV
ncbi:MAG: 2TM domain-containing protein [Saprospiraceae bacterium]